jgi:hypothetical protein
VTAAAAFVTVPAMDDTALLAVEARLFVTVPTVPTVLFTELFTELPTAPVTLVTLATPEVSVVAVGVVGVPLLEVFPLVVTEPVAVVAPAVEAPVVASLTDDGQEAAPSVTPELVV